MYNIMVNFIDGICDLSWPLMASKMEKCHVLVLFILNFFQYEYRNGIQIASEPKIGVLFGGIIEGQMVLDLRP